jgi:lysyl-tRNA synthetase class 2
VTGVPRDTTQPEQDSTLALRRAKAQRLRESGHDPFPHSFAPRQQAATVLAAHDAAALDPGRHPEHEHSVGGRLVARREHGKSAFLDLQDQSGTIQVYARRDDLGDEEYERLMDADLGDTIGVRGCLYVTRIHTLAIHVEEHEMLAKALVRPPDLHHGVTDVEKRFRQRELDLMANPETRELFAMRARMLAAVREWLNGQGYVEVDTPMFHSVAGGAAAKPFVTHYNALGADVTLRISTELYLKRVLIGGLEKVYDLGKCFRNEGISHKHSPEFTMLEFFQTYADWETVMDELEEMVATVTERVRGTTEVEWEGHTIDFGRPWRRATVRELIREATGVEIMDSTAAQLRELLSGSAPDTLSWDATVMEVYAHLVEPTLIQPTFVLEFPAEGFPLTKRRKHDPTFSEFFDMVAGGIELSSGSTDINDPDEQRERLMRQSTELGNDEQAQPYNEEYVQALEYGLPPVAGAGLGIDRLLMILSGRPSLREVIPFPTMRSAGAPAADAT